MATLQQRCQARKLTQSIGRYFIYKGWEHDLYLSLPDYDKLQSRFTIIFDKLGQEPPIISFRKKKYSLNGFPLLLEDSGYYCISGKFKGSKGLHHIPLHRLAYVAFYGRIPVNYHIHHIDRNKHNNAADNLVALTEEEHCREHNRDVRISRNLFSSSPKKGLLQKLAPKLLADDLYSAIMAKSTPESLSRFVDEVLSDVQYIEDKTILQTLCLIAKDVMTTEGGLK